MALSLIPFDLILYIESFICILDKKYNPKFLSKELNQYIKCKVIKYKDLISCKCHNNKDLFDCINILKENQNNSKISTIHFENLNSMNYAKKYLSYFGEISHFCCSGKGVMYKNDDEEEKEEDSSLSSTYLNVINNL